MQCFVTTVGNHSGHWLGGFTYNIGCCSVDEAEAWGVLQRMTLAARWGFRNIIVESYSMTMIESLHGVTRLHGHVNNIISRCMKARKDFANMDFCHVYMEQNRVADALAKQAGTHDMGIIMMDEANWAQGDTS